MRAELESSINSRRKQVMSISRVAVPIRFSPVLRALVATTLICMPLLASAGTWQTLKNPPPIPEIIDPSGVDFGPGGATGPLLLTDGGVLIQNAGPGA